MSLSIYKSSAGSGKTYTLAKEYIKLLLQNPRQHPHILAVTFTNKATQEMKERIIKFLIQLAKNENKALANQLISDGFLQSHIQQNAKIALEQIMHNYGDFSVVTIDSFFNRLIKSFAHELKLPLRMEVQIDSNEALEDAFDRLMLQLGTDHELVQYITNFMFYKLDQDKGWYVEREIKSLGTELFKESFDPVFKSLDKVEISKITQLIEEIINYLSRINNQIKDLGHEWLEYMDSYNLTVEDFIYGKAGVGNFGTHLVNVYIDKLADPGVRVLEALDSVEKWHTKKSVRAAEIQDCAANHLMAIALKALQIWEDAKSQYYINQMLFKNLHALGLLKNINEQLKAYRDENDRIMISDQNRLINEIISQSDIPFLYEKTGTKYQHFLLDEFQDTSGMQWQNFRPLLENALAEGGNILVVGDAKQSIYRWRGGEMKLLLEKIGEDLSAFFQEGITIKNLDANYRSRAEIIDFNNKFFGGIAQSAPTVLNLARSPLAEMAFADVSQKSTEQTKNGGFVHIEFIDKLNDDGNEMKAKDIVDKRLLQTITDLKSEGYAWNDLACLVFTNAHGTRVAELLSKNGIPVQSSDSLLLKNAASVRFVITLLKHIQNPDDALYRGEVCLLLWQLEKLEINQSNADNELHSILQQAKDSLDGFDAILPDNLLSAIKTAKGNLLHQVNQLICGADLETLNPEYLQRFTEIVYQYEINHESNLSDFLLWWDETKNQHCIQSPENENAVVILTIHRAKGLQYPVVLMPYAKRGLDTKSSDILWLQNQGASADWLEFLPLNYTKKLENTIYENAYLQEKEHALVDALNMLYVAFTRPEERLYIFANHKEAPNISTASLLFNLLKNHHELKDFFAEDIFEFGHKVAPTQKSRQEHIGLNSLVKNTTNPPLLRAPRLRISDLRAGKIKPFQKGILLHELLAKIQHENDLDKCLLLAVSEGLIQDDEQAFWREKLTEILNLSEIKKWNEEALEQLNEQEFLTKNGTLRPDKIYILPDKIVLIDYKTGSPNAEHEKQVLEYLALVASLQIPSQTIKEVEKSLKKIETSSLKLEAYILYTQTLQLIKVA